MTISEIISGSGFKIGGAVTKGAGSKIVSVEQHPPISDISGKLSDLNTRYSPVGTFELYIDLPTGSGITKLFDSDVEGKTLQNITVDSSGTVNVWINQDVQTADNKIQTDLVTLQSFEDPIRTIYVQAVSTTRPVSIYGAPYITPHTI